MSECIFLKMDLCEDVINRNERKLIYPAVCYQQRYRYMMIEIESFKTLMTSLGQYPLVLVRVAEKLPGIIEGHKQHLLGFLHQLREYRANLPEYDQLEDGSIWIERITNAYSIEDNLLIADEMTEAFKKPIPIIFRECPASPLTASLML